MNHPAFDAPLSGGLIVVGTQAQCGKTALTAGLALALGAMGQRVLPVAPVEMDSAPDKQITGQYILNHLCRQTGTPLAEFQPVLLPAAGHLTKNHWHHLISQLGQQPYPVIVDTPSGAALPWSLSAPLDSPLGQGLGQGLLQGLGYSAIGLAYALGWPLLIATPKSPAVVANLWPTLQWLKKMPVSLAGWVAVEQTPLDLAANTTWDAMTAWLHCESPAPFLGCLSHAPQLSIPMGYTGDLVQRIEDGLDLLPLQLALGL